MAYNLDRSRLLINDVLESAFSKGDPKKRCFSFCKRPIAAIDVATNE
jgi:hypothetical protein